MKLSIIIPTSNREQILCNTIDSILEGISNSSYSNVSEIIIVDQTKCHSELVSQYLQKISLYTNVNYIYEEMANLPNARNVGLKAAKGDIMVFLDDDVILHDDFFNILVETYTKHSDVSAVVGDAVLKNQSGENILLDKNSFLKTFFRKLLTLLFCREKASVITRWGLMLSNRENSSESYAESGRGCVMSFKRALLDEIGCFDSNYQGNALREESDVFVRVKKYGRKVYFNPAIKVDHIMANEGGCRSEKTEDYWQTFFNNQIYFYRKNFGFPNWYIKLLLAMDIIKIKKQGFNVEKLFDNAFSRSVELLKK